VKQFLLIKNLEAMKKILLSISLSVMVAIFGNLFAQTSSPALQNPPLSVCTPPTGSGPASCAIICTNSGQFTDNGNGTFTFRFVFIKNSSGAKSIRLNITCGTTVVINDCINLTPLTQGVQYFVTSTFPCASLSGVTVTLTPYTNGTCGGGVCGAVVRSIGGAPLPVQFTSFTAKRNNASSVGLVWQTASELNNTGFEVQRNISGSWETVAFVPTQAAGGNSDALLTYTYSDMNSAKGMTQYRIKQIDFDGKSEYSSIRAVRGESVSVKTVLYPNPSFDGRVNVVFEDANGTRDIVLMDMSGRMIRNWKGVSNNNLVIDNLNPGMYSLRITVRETGAQTVEKLVVNKR
jgi:hypothetical protein